MKVRQGFVSNSSSSSFIVIKNNNLVIPEFSEDILEVPESFGGNLEFGWGPNDHFDFGSKLNFAYMQTQYRGQEVEPLLEKAMNALDIETNPWLNLLETVLKENLRVKEIEWNIDMENIQGYIDHQSNASRGENTEMFDSAEALKNFLFSQDSIIHEDNDNH